jgi:DNA-binding transcriptional regulator YhcF (GntR family)
MDDERLELERELREEARSALEEAVQGCFQAGLTLREILDHVESTAVISHQ